MMIIHQLDNKCSRFSCNYNQAGEIDNNQVMLAHCSQAILLKTTIIITISIITTQIQTTSQVTKLFVHHPYGYQNSVHLIKYH